MPRTIQLRFLIALAAWWLPGLATASAQVIVVNGGVKMGEISKAEVHDIFTGASDSFRNGGHAVPVTLKSGVVHDDFLREYIGKSDPAFRAVWRGVVFAGHGTMPIAFDTEAEVLQYVASKPGAIGYVSASATLDKVKAVVVR